MTASDPVALMDFGDAARLERFGGRLVDRPHPGALASRRDPDAWREASLHFDRDAGWSGPGANLGAWTVDTEDLTLELRPTDTGQVGLFPEHALMLPWLREQVVSRATGGDPPPTVLHLFAYTGLGTLTMARSGAAVTHVDSARPSVVWARRNADLSGLADRPIRWIVDDARAFVEREARRGRRYVGLVLDPPTYGHGAGGRAWRIETDLEPLLAVCARTLDPGAFVLLTAHTATLGPDELGDALVRAMHVPPSSVEVGPLGLTAVDGRLLELGSFARSTGTPG